jgi:hypothetical protein
MTLFCEHKDLLGAPGEGFHAQRFLGMAAWDLLAMFGLACLVTFSVHYFSSHVFTGSQILCVFLGSFVGLWVLATVLHWMFCVETPVTKTLSLN